MTRDGGKTWTSINGTGLTCKKVARIVVDPHDPNRLYLGTTGNGVFVGRVSNPREARLAREIGESIKAGNTLELKVCGPFI